MCCGYFALHDANVGIRPTHAAREQERHGDCRLTKTFKTPCRLHGMTSGDDKYEEGVSLGRCADDWITRPLQGLIESDKFAH
jgi:hypothetical protein